jgi:3-hydroxybutyryl-CoA dehydratase
MTNRNTPPAAGEFKFSKTLTVAEQALFTGISGNMGAQYVDATRGRKNGTGGLMVFELAVAALATTGLAKLGGPGRRIAAMDVGFARPVTVGATIEAQAQVEQTQGDTLVCRIRCTDAQTGETVVEGTAHLVPLTRG